MRWKRISALLLSAAALLGITGCQSDSSAASEEASGTAAVSPVTVTAFSVGKADALVLQTENTVTVIDTGNKGDGKTIEKYLSNQGIDLIDTLIITHFDRDHVGGAARLVNRMKIGQIYVPDYKSDKEEYLNFLEKTEEQQCSLTALPVRESVSWQADDAAFTLYAANETFYGKNEENDFSLCLLVQHGSNKLLFTGDAEDARMKEIAALGIGQVDFLKFPYHGNYLPGTEAFLDAVQPKTAVICCSDKENADPSTVKTLEKRGVEAYYTNRGTVTVVSDGSTLQCTQTE